jgi:hypothetical protein
LKGKIYLTELPGTETLVIRKDRDSTVFILTADSIIVSKAMLITLLNHMIKNNFLSVKTIEGLLEEYNTE